MKKTSPYRICLICWLGALSIAIAIGLGYYFDFLVDYENVYQSSRPFHKMDEIMLSFEQMDMDTIYNWISQKPEINAFETEENVKNYMRRLLSDATFSYAETDNSFEERPEYYIFANDYIIAKLSLKKRTNEYLPYGFPIWDISDFEFYTQADYECSVLTPNNGTIYLNGIPVSDDYCYQRVIVIDERSYVEDYATLPAYRKYRVDGFYEEPSLTAVNSFAQACPIAFNRETGMYEVDFGEPEPQMTEEMKSYAIETATAYANCISHDISTTELATYFVPDCPILDRIREGVRTNYFSPHTTPVISNEEIKRFTVYSENVYVCEVSLQQDLVAYGRPETVITDLTFFFVNTPEGWKVCNIMY